MSIMTATGRQIILILTVILFTVLIFTSHAYGNVEFHDRSSNDSVGLGINKSATSTTTRQRVAPKPGSRIIEQLPSGSTNTRNGGGRSANRQAIVDPRAKWARSILRTICTL